MKDWQPWVARWEQLFHQALELAPMQQRGLSLTLRRYRFAQAEAMGCRFLAVLSSAQGTPKGYRHSLQQLGSLFSGPAVFFLPGTPSYQYSRLIKAGIPFFTLAGPAYIPQLYLYLTPGNSSAAQEARAALSPAAQALLLRQLTRGDMQGCSLSRASALLSYSPMAMTNAKNELVRHGLCRYVGSRTRSLLDFDTPAQALWEQAQGVLRSPVLKRHFLDRVPAALPQAGESALAAQTLLVDGELPTYAVGKDEFKNTLAQQGIRECDPEDAAAIVEKWMYPPPLLMPPASPLVDPYSLTLSLRDSQDDRVQQELAKLLPPTR